MQIVDDRFSDIDLRLASGSQMKLHVVVNVS